MTVSQQMVLDECRPRLRRFLWWSWLANTHCWDFLERLSRGIPVGGAEFTDLYRCAKCGQTMTDVYEAYGP
jgi:hypothetical protein